MDDEISAYMGMERLITIDVTRSSQYELDTFRPNQTVSYMVDGPQREELHKLTNEIVQSADHPLKRRSEIVLDILLSPQAHSIENTLSFNPISDESIAEEMQRAEYEGLFNFLLDNRQMVPQQLYLFVHYAKNSAYLDKIHKQIHPHSIEGGPSFIYSHHKWELCYEAESLMHKANLQKATIVLTDKGNELGLLKFKGRLSAFTFRDFVSNGEFIPAGVWISPIDRSERKRLKRSFAWSRTQKEFSEIGNQPWVVLRNYNPGNYYEHRNGIDRVLTDTLAELPTLLEKKYHYPPLKRILHLPERMIYSKIRGEEM